MILKIKELLKKYKGELLLLLFTLYVFLLGLGIIGEIFEIQWILNLPIY